MRLPNATPLLLLLALGTTACPTPADPDAGKGSLDDSGDPAQDTGGTDLVDQDDDGYTEADDCDDDDPTTYPGADELCDGLDNDCDDEVDEDPVDPSTWYLDADGDGVGGSETETACDAPDRYVDTTGDCDEESDAAAYIYPGAAPSDSVDACMKDADGDGWGDSDVSLDWVEEGTDCDDGDAALNPGADETWYDGVDGDCDGGSDYDADGDGHDSIAHFGDDCDDERPDVGPSAWDGPTDGVDANCDGEADAIDTAFVDVEVSLGEVKWTNPTDIEVGPAGPDGAPTAMVCAGYLFVYAVDDLLADPDGEVPGTDYKGSISGYTVSSIANLGDYDGDGVPEYIVGQYNTTSDGGYLNLFAGEDLYAGSTSSAKVTTSTIHPEPGLERFGYDVAAISDFDEDSRQDLAVGSKSERAFVFRSSTIYRGGDFDLDDSHLVVEHFEEDALGRWTSSTDIDGDGLDELFLNLNDDVAFVVAGEHVESGGTLSTDDAVAQISGSDRPLATTDVDRDGYGDFITLNYEAGRLVYAYAGPSISGTVETSAAWMTIGSESDDHPRESGSVGDVDGDGLLDLALVASGGTDAEGQVVVFSDIGSAAGSVYLENADWAWYANSASGHQFSDTHLAIGDLDSDGVDDLAMLGRSNLLLSLSPY